MVWPDVVCKHLLSSFWLMIFLYSNFCSWIHLVVMLCCIVTQPPTNHLFRCKLYCMGCAPQSRNFEIEDAGHPYRTWSPAEARYIAHGFVLKWASNHAKNMILNGAREDTPRAFWARLKVKVGPSTRIRRSLFPIPATWCPRLVSSWFE